MVENTPTRTMSWLASFMAATSQGPSPVRCSDGSIFLRLYYMATATVCRRLRTNARMPRWVAPLDTARGRYRPRGRQPSRDARRQAPRHRNQFRRAFTVRARPSNIAIALSGLAALGAESCLDAHLSLLFGGHL